MAYELDPQLVKAKALELGYAARTVIQQLASMDRTPEGLKAGELLEQALMKAVPDGAEKETADVHGK